MATGPEHWARAEELIATAENPLDFDLTQAERNTIALGAQVHATLAATAAFLAAAVIHPDDRYAWDHAMGRTQEEAA